MIRGWFQSHTWDSYRWSNAWSSWIRASCMCFNLTLEILIVDRYFQGRFNPCAIRVSISHLRFLSLIAGNYFDLSLLISVSISHLRFLSLIGAASERVGYCHDSVSISHLRFLSLIAANGCVGKKLRVRFQSHTWDSYRWSNNVNHFTHGGVTGVSISHLRFLSLIAPRPARLPRRFTMFQSHTWDSYRWSFLLSVCMRSGVNTFQSHTWDSYRWSSYLFRFCLCFYLCFCFNLTLEILIVDRKCPMRAALGDSWVSISHLRFLSLIVGLWTETPPAIKPGFNLTLEILIVDRTKVKRSSTLVRSIVSISHLRFLSLIGIMAGLGRISAKMFQSHTWDSYRWSAGAGDSDNVPRARFNLTLEIIIVDRSRSAGGNETR